jgi:hypothetical protein
LPTSTERRHRRGFAALLLACGAALALAGCDEAQVSRPAPPATQTPFVLGSLPPIGFNHRYGNNPVAAADAFALERQLYAQRQYWEVGMHAEPAGAGYVDETDAAATAAARPQFTSLRVIIASESLPTLRALLARGDPGQQAYCEGLVAQLRARGYTGLATLALDVFFGESDRHAELTWSRAAGYHYTIFDGDLRGALSTPIPTSTPFTTPPAR